ncbi:MAG: putative peptidoglycan lipid II flippase [Alphaproteobacteria bacterium]|jgi:putative peptidoglycan lipid II flippase
MKQRIVDFTKQHMNKLFLMKISATQVIVSFLTNILILRSIGLGGDLDVFYIGMSVFAFLYTSINWSISSILAPYLIDQRGNGKEGALFVTVAIMVLPIAAIVYLTMPFWVDYLYVNYLDTVDRSKIIAVQGMLIAAYIVDGFILVYTGMLQEKNKYITFNASMLAASIIGFIFVYLTLDDLGVYAAALNQLLMKTVILLIMCFMFLPHILKTISFDKEQFRLIFSRTKYLLLGSLYFRTDEVVERYIASYLAGGFVSLVGFIQRVYGAIITVLNSAIGVPAITVFGDLISMQKFESARQNLMKYMAVVFLGNAFIFIILALVGPKLFLFIMGDTLTAELEELLYISILCLYMMVLGKTIAQVLQSLLMAMKKVGVSIFYDSLTYTINVALKISLTVMYGVHGFLVAIVLSVVVMDGTKVYVALNELKKMSKNQ